uniref:Uncharacterized protein n=1 Tax=Haptolina ericina TaxID=156174 RepID=A0A7S3AXV2_9EUKA
MISAMRSHQLDVASPALVGALFPAIAGPDGCERCRRGETCQWAGCRWPLAAKGLARSDGCVRFENSIETSSTFYSRSAWECMNSLYAAPVPWHLHSRPDNGAFVRCYAAHCPKLARQAIVLSQLAVHDELPPRESLEAMAGADEPSKLVEKWVHARDGEWCADARTVQKRLESKRPKKRVCLNDETQPGSWSLGR